MADEEKDSKVEEQDSEEIEESKDEEKVEDKEEEQEEEQEEDDFVPSSEQKNLLKLLSNPGTARNTVALLAKQLGIAIPEEKPVSKSVRDEVLDYLKETLGKDWNFLSEPITNAIEKFAAASSKTLQRRFDESEQERVQRESDNATEKLYKEYPDAKNYEKDMLRIMEEMPADPKIPPYKYLENVYLLAKARKGKDAISRKVNERISKNAQDENIKASRTDEQPSSKRPQARISIRDAVRQAEKQLRQKS